MGWGQDWGTALYGDPGAPLLDYIEGFEHQTLSTLQFGGSGEGLFDSLQNSAGMSIITGRTGGSALHIDDSDNTLATAAERLVPLSQHRVFSGYFRLAAQPSVASFIWTLYSSAPSQMARMRINTDGTLTVSCVDGTGQSNSADLCDNAWHLIDVWVDSSCVSSDTWSVHWTLDGVTGTTATSASGKAAVTSQPLWLGSLTTTHTAIVDWDDCIGSASAGTYPLGAHVVNSVVPASDGTHVAGTNVIESGTGVDIGATTAFNLMDEWPANTTDYVRQFATGTGNYAEVNFADTTDTTIWGAIGLVAGFASGATADTGTTRIVDAANATVVDIYAGDMSQTSLHYRTAIIPVPSGGWTPTLLNALKARVGFSSDVTTVPRWSSLMVQYVVPTANPQEVDAGFINRTPSVFTPSTLLHPKATVALIASTRSLFTPKVNQKLTVGLINRTGTPFAPSKFNQKVGALLGVFDEATFQNSAFQDVGSGFFIQRTPVLFAPGFPSLPQTVTLPGVAAAAAFQDNAFQDEVFQDLPSGGGYIAYVGAPFTLSITGQAVAAFVYLTGTGGWDSSDITWDDTDTDWDAAGLGGQINQSGHAFAPSVKEKVTLGLISRVPVLFAPSPGSSSFGPLPIILRVGFTYTPQQVTQKVNVGLISQVGVTFTPVASIPQTVTVGLIASTVVLYEFQLNPQAIAVPLISRVGFPHTPAVTEKVTLGLIASTVAVFTPIVNAFAPPLISNVGVVFTPTSVVFNPDDVFPGLIASTVEVFTPPLFLIPFQQTIRLDETAEQFIDNAGTVFQFVSVELGHPQSVFIATIHQEGVAIEPRVFRASFVIPRARKIATYQPILRLCSTYDPILRKEASTLGVKAPITKADAWFVGEDQTFEFLSLTAGLPDNVTGWTIQFRMATDDGEPSLLTIAAVLTDPTHGVFQIVSPSATTLSLEPDVYYYDVSRLDAGSNQVLAFGPAHLQARVT